MVEHGPDDYIAFRLVRAFGPPSSFREEAPDHAPATRLIGAPGDLHGELVSRTPFEPSGPTRICQLVTPFDIGRAHVQVVFEMPLPVPELFGPRVELRCGPDTVELHDQVGRAARWAHWYADWRPSVFRGLGSTVCHVVAGRASNLERARLHAGWAERVWVDRSVGSRTESYRDLEDERSGFWMDLALGTVEPAFAGRLTAPYSASAIPE